MARAIAGGLAFSTVVSLLFLPTIYAMLDDLRNATSRGLAKARRRRGDPLQPAAVAAISAECWDLSLGERMPEGRRPGESPPASIYLIFVDVVEDWATLGESESGDYDEIRKLR